MRTRKLQQILTNVNRIVPNNPSISALRNIEFNGSEMVAGDLTTYAAIDAVMLPGKWDNISIDFKSFYKFIKALPKDKEISFGLDTQHETPYVCVLVNDNEKARFKANGEVIEKKAEDFSANTHLIKSELLDWIYAHKSMLSRDELRPAMLGFYFDFKKNNVVATDGRRLAIKPYDFDLKGSGFIFRPEITSFLSAKNTDIKLEVGKSWAKLEIEPGFKVFTRCIDERYPDYEAVIPTDFDQFFKFDISKLQTEVKQALSIAGDNKDIAFGGSRIYAGDEDKIFTGNPISETKGNEYPIGFNGAYILDLVKANKKADIMEFSTEAPNRGALVKVDNADHYYVQMPVHLSEDMKLRLTPKTA